MTKGYIDTVPCVGGIDSRLPKGGPILGICLNDLHTHVFGQSSQKESPGASRSKVILSIFCQSGEVRDILIDRYPYHFDRVDHFSRPISSLGVCVFGSELYKELIPKGLIIGHSQRVCPF